MIHLLPLTLSWLAGAALLLFDGRKRPVAIGAAVILFAVLAADLVLLLRMHAGMDAPFETVTGSWPSELGIRLRVDRLSLLFGALCAAVLAAVMAHEARAAVRSKAFPALLLMLSAGLHGAFFTGDLFNFYVFFELSVVSSFVLAAYGYGGAEIRGTFVYVALNLLGSVLFVGGVAVTYQTTGTLDLASIAASRTEGGAGMPVLAGALILVSLSLKLGLFPFHGWVPVLYSHARPAVAAAMSGALVNIGIYGLLRFGFAAAEESRDAAAGFLVALGSASALYGALLAAHRRTPPETIAYASVAQAGYVVLAIGIGGVHGVLAAVLTALSGSLDKCALFLSLPTTGASRSWAALLAGCSVAGLPVTTGFLAKVELVRAGAAAPAAWAVVAAVVVSATLTLYAISRFWRLSAGDAATTRDSHPGRIALALAVVTVGLGIAADPLTRLLAALSRDLLGGAT